MKTILLLAAFLFTLTSTRAQVSGTTLKRHPIGNSGCTVANYCVPKYAIDYSTDSSKVYTGECEHGGITYGVICIKLLHPVTDLVMAEDLMIAYADYLKGSFTIIKSVGYGRGLFLNKNENTRGIVDYWEDAEKDKWKIKAWTDGNYIGFMYVYSKKELPEGKVNVFLEGFRLPVSER